ncbi:MAG: LCP family protein [Actinobacteria bacterium]|nr:LCP family protein [Actinomycetota bacterium]
MSLPPDRFDFSDLATPSRAKALGGELPSTTQEGSDGAREPRRGPTGSVLAALVAPGAGSFFRRRVLSWSLLLLGFVIPLAAIAVAIIRRQNLTSLVLDTTILLSVQIIALLFVVTRVVAVVEVIRSRNEGSPRRLASWVACVGVIVLALPAMWSVVRSQDLSGAINDVFVSSGNDAPLATAGDGSTVGDGSTAVDGSTVDDGFQTILLLGGDAGPGRSGLRTDSMILVTIHQESGRMAMISIPRNLCQLKFPPGSAMAQEFPDGFTQLTNAVYTYVISRPEIAASYAQGNLQPEVVALASGLSYSMDMTIDDYVLINMQGFADIVDALGGVTMTLAKEIPLPRAIPGSKTPNARSIGPGVVTMDGTTAIAFARTRKADSDYNRMGRQREILAALAAQASGTDLLSKFPRLTEIISWTVRTSLSTDEFGELVDRVRRGARINESVGLVPPLVNTGNPNYADVAMIIDALQNALRDNLDFPDT